MKTKLLTVLILISQLFCFINNNVYCIAPSSGLLQKSNITNNAWIRAWLDVWSVMEESVHAFLMPHSREYSPEAISFLTDIFLEMQKIPDEEVLGLLKNEIRERNYGATDKLGKGYYFQDPYDIRTLFITVTAEESIMGTMKGLLPYCQPEIFDLLILNDEERLEENKKNIAFYYLLFRGIYILSRKSHLVLIQKEDIEPLTQLLIAYNVRLEQFLTIASVLIPVDSTSKREAIMNMLEVIEQVSESNEQWSKDMNVQDNLRILDSLRQSNSVVESATRMTMEKSL